MHAARRFHPHPQSRRQSKAIRPFTGVVELVCGALIIAGLFTRFAIVPLILTMIVALISIKLPILLGYGFGPFGLPDLK